MPYMDRGTDNSQRFRGRTSTIRTIAKQSQKRSIPLLFWRNRYMDNEVRHVNFL